MSLTVMLRQRERVVYGCMRRADVLLEAMLALFGSWTLAYHVVLATGWPAWTVCLVWLAVLVPVVGPLVPRWWRGVRRRRSDWRFAAGLWTLALVSGGITLVNTRPDNDDLSFFHRAVAQLHHLDLPFFVTDTMHNVAGLPPLSLVHVSTSYEPLVALSAWLVGLDPVWLYQNGGALVAGALLPVVYVALYQRMRLGRFVALFAALCALLFLLLDGNTHRSFGNVGLVRLWQGKTILWTLFLPVTILVALRFLQRPNPRRFWLVVLVTICGVGLSNAGIFLVPMEVFVVSVAYLLGYGFRRRLWRVVLLNLASVYCVAIAGALELGWLWQPTNTIEWTIGWTTVWWENLDLVIGGWWALLRDVLVVAVLPFVAFRRPLGRLFPLLGLSLVLLVATPLTAPFWMDKLWPSGYWRVVYLLPLPWCAGLVVCGVDWRRGAAMAAYRWRLAVAALVLLAIAGAFQLSVLSPANGVSLKSPWEAKFRPDDLAFAQRVAPLLHRRNLLTTENMAVVVALRDPTLRLEAARTAETLHAFRNANQEPEGLRRAAAQMLVSFGQRSPEGDAALLESTRHGVDAMIVPAPAAPTLEALLQTGAGRWNEAARDDHYVLLLRDP